MAAGRKVNIGCIQTPAHETFDAAIDIAKKLSRNAVEAGAELLCLPEYCGGLKSDRGIFRPPAAPESEHPVLEALRSFACQNSVWVLIGSLAVEGPNERLINRGFLVDSKGNIRARYDKIHLFDINLSYDECYRESTVVNPGSEAVVGATPWGLLGMTTCYDLRFPHLYRQLAQGGAEILAIPAAFTKKTGEAHWRVLNQARAIENGAVVVAPCSTGVVPGGGMVYGHSLVVSPWGEVLCDGGEGPGYQVVTVDLEVVAKVRKQIPSLKHDRPFKLKKVNTG